MTAWETRKNRPTKLTHRGPSPQPFEQLPMLPNGVEEVKFESGSLKLKGWFVASESKEEAPTLIYLHGGFAFGLSDLADVKAFHEVGFHLFAPSWRGENGNPGFHELCYGEVDDAVAAIKWLRNNKDVDQDNIYVLGHSAGGMISAILSAAPDLPVKETASIGGLYTPEVIAQFGELPFDTSDSDELRLRSFLPYQSAMRRPHVAYVGREDSAVAVDIGRFGGDNASQLQIVKVPGDHFQSLNPGVLAYRERVLEQMRQSESEQAG